MSKAKGLIDAVRIIEERVKRFRAEAPWDKLSPSDRAAIAEAEHCAKLIRLAAMKPYRGDPYTAAYKRWNHGEYVAIATKGSAS